MAETTYLHSTAVDDYATDTQLPTSTITTLTPPIVETTHLDNTDVDAYTVNTESPTAYVTQANNKDNKSGT